MTVVKELFDSKKFVSGFIMSLVIFCGQFFTALALTGEVLLALSVVDWLAVATPVLVAIGAQGAADFNKEAKKIEAQSYAQRTWTIQEHEASSKKPEG